MPNSLLDIPFIANTRYQTSDTSNTPAVELSRIQAAYALSLDIDGVMIYSSNTARPEATGLNAGQIIYETSSNTYQYSTGTDWVAIPDTYPDPYTFQGSNYGYSSGGSPTTTTIEKISFATDGNATNVGDLTDARYRLAGQSSSDYGYSSGGSYPAKNVIDKFPFAADGTATDVGDLTSGRTYNTGHSVEEYGYTSGGLNPPTTYVDTIDSFPFASDDNATDVGNLSIARRESAGQSSADYGYNCGGMADPAYSPYRGTRIYKFPFSSSFGYTSTVGELSVSRYGPVGQSSVDYGYSSGGYGPSYSTVIDKFPFATDANATDVGDLTSGRHSGSGQSSTEYGYTSGGVPIINTIDKFPFASDGTATDVGDLTAARIGAAGQQY